VKLRAILADDHPFVLLGVRAALADDSDIEVVGEARSANELLELLGNVPCEVVVTDLTMPAASGEAQDGLRLMRRLRQDWPGIRVVVLTNVVNPAVLRAVAHTGVVAMLHKSEPIGNLAGFVRAAAQGAAGISPVIGRALASADDHAAISIPRLTPRESEVIRKFVSGISISEIARALDRDVRTVSRQKREAMAKLGVSNDAGIFALVRTHGLL
jgi:two-component system, NarL family, captular synthesis response regulator RcsB